jgi:hypothetical protein
MSEQSSLHSQKRTTENVRKIAASNIKLAANIKSLPNDIQVTLWEKVLQRNIERYKELNPIYSLRYAPFQFYMAGDQPVQVFDFEYNNEPYHVNVVYEPVDVSEIDRGVRPYGRDVEMKNIEYIDLWGSAARYISFDAFRNTFSVLNLMRAPKTHRVPLMYALIMIVRRLLPNLTPDDLQVHDGEFSLRSDGSIIMGHERIWSLEEYMKHAKEGHEGGKSQREHLMFNKRRYKVHTDKEKKRYIHVQREKVYLSTIQGKYRYCA